MTPAARIAASIEILDEVLDGMPAEKALTNWTRRSRFAGSKDRAAVRDFVFDALRQKLSCAVLGGGESGRLIALGLVRKSGLNVDEMFNGVGHGPGGVTEEERVAGRGPTGLDALDWPKEMEVELRLGQDDQFEAICTALQSRAPVFVRVNLRKISVEDAVRALADEEIGAAPFPVSSTALLITKNPRRIKNSLAYKDGLIELQDASSQAVVDMVPLQDDLRVLDYCAGGGGKTLAMAGRANARFFAHDVNEARMKDLPLRALRAGVEVQILDQDALNIAASFDLVFVDAPCSGSGAWRRSPEAKWALTSDRLDELCQLQQDILSAAAKRVDENGVLVYATCSLFERENMQQVERFVQANPEWKCGVSKQFIPVSENNVASDGFFAALLTRA